MGDRWQVGGEGRVRFLDRFVDEAEALSGGVPEFGDLGRLVGVCFHCYHFQA